MYENMWFLCKGMREEPDAIVGERASPRQVHRSIGRMINQYHQGKEDPVSASGPAANSERAERNTRQRQAIRDAFTEATRPLSSDEVHASASRQSPGLGIATVYRSIKALVDEGLLSIVEVPGRAPLYETAGKAHHHHFSCTACSRVYELEGCATVRAAMPDGFRESSHELTIFGTCAACNRERRTRRGR